MAKRAQQYRVTWDTSPKDFEDLNKKLTTQLHRIDEMLQTLFDNTSELSVAIDEQETDALEVATGDWTPTDNSGAGLFFTNVDGEYLKIGSFVLLTGALTYPATASGLNALVAGFPFTPVNQTGQALRYGGFIHSSSEATAVKLMMIANGTGIQFLTAADTIITNATLTTNYINFVVTYRTDD